jgi:hypothetical protein
MLRSGTATRGALDPQMLTLDVVIDRSAEPRFF